ncbi:MAG: RNA polymerase sigma factor [Dehalococcoidia bacterium]
MSTQGGGLRPGLSGVGPHNASREDQLLVAAVVGRDHLAFRRLYDRHSRLLLHIAYETLQSWEAAEEVVQDVFIQCWQQADRYRVSRGSPAAWLVTMARSRAIDRLRSENAAKRGSGRSIPLEHVQERFLVLHGQVGARLETGDVASALRELPSDVRTAILLASHAGLSQTEIARFMEVPHGTVKSWIRRGLLRLREQLRPGSSGDE